jgi:hypothetical protein
MKIPLRIFLALSLFVVSVALVHATQETILVREARLFGERAIAQGFQCRTQVHSTSGKKFEVAFDMDENLLYHIAIVTGYGEKAAHPRDIMLVDERQRSIKLEFQNTTFGSELKFHPLSTGAKVLQFAMPAKTDYTVVVCANYGSLYHTGEKDPVFDNHGHF